MGIDGSERKISLSSLSPGWEKDPDLQTDVSPETQLEQKQRLEQLEQLPLLLDAVMKVLPEQEGQALRQILYTDRASQRSQGAPNRRREAAQQMSKRVSSLIRRPEVQASIRQLLGGPQEILIPETIRIRVTNNLKGKILPQDLRKEVTKEKFEDEVMGLFDGKSFLTPEGIAEALGCQTSWVYLVIIRKLYERELATRNGAEQTNAPHKNPDTMQQ